jgi:hypothetical protein
MHRLTLLASLLLAAGSLAQTPLITLTGGTNQGNVGNNIYFDLQINQTITINQIRFLCGLNTVASTAGAITIYLGPTSYVGATSLASAGLWTPVATATGLTVTPSTICTANLAPGLCLGPGNYGVAIKSTAFNHGYTNGVTCTSNTIPGACSNSTFTRTELVLRGGANQNYPWGNGSAANEGINQPRIFNGEIHYTPGGTPIAVAAWQPVGKACYGFYHSFREYFGNPSTSFDLDAATGTNSLHLTYAATGYIISPFVNGTGTWYTSVAPVSLGLTENTAALIPLSSPFLYPTPGGPQATSQLEVCDNGFISPGTTNPASVTNPTAAAFLAGNPRWAPCWMNFTPSNPTVPTAGVYYEFDVPNNKLYVTWDQLADFGPVAASTNTFQMMFDLTNNDVEFRWRLMTTQQGGTYPAVAGWTTGGSTLDQGDVDISAIASTFITGPIDQHPLTLGLSQRPLLGTTPIFNITNMEPSQTFGGLMVNFADGPHTEMLAFGMPSCFQHVSNIGAITMLYIGSPGVVSFTIPNITSFNGVLVYGQALGLGAVENSAFGLGINASNGVRLTLGNL